MLAVILSTALRVMLTVLIIITVIVADRRSQDRKSDTDGYINKLDEKLSELVEALALPDIAEQMATMTVDELAALAGRVHDLKNRVRRAS